MPGQTQIPISGLKRRTIPIRSELHFSGGMRASIVGAGWALTPLLREGRIQAVGTFRDEQIGHIGDAIGLTRLGVDAITEFDTPLPTRIWTPLLGPPNLKSPPSDTWGMISSQARIAEDGTFARLASNVAVSLRAAGLQLRNASDEYHKQLLAALASGKSIDRRFQNVPMDILHLAFHSALAEMASARDYLAQVTARRVRAPESKDSLARLRDWAEKPANAAARSDPLLSRLLEASDASASDPWLADITEYRNLFLHRDHIGSVARWLKLEEHQSPIGPVRTVTMAINVRPGSETMCEALVRFVELYSRLCHLADFAATLAPYAAVPPAFVATSS